MTAIVKLDDTLYVKRLIKSMRDPTKWDVECTSRETGEQYLMRYSFDNGQKRIAYAPSKVQYESEGHLFRLSLSGAPDLKLSFLEGIQAYLAFRFRVREFRKETEFRRKQKTINFLRESGV